MSAEMGSSTSRDLVYVRLLNEGTIVYRPVRAKSLGGRAYQLDASAEYDQEDEAWEFAPGSAVVCEPRRLDGDTVLVAIGLR
jgi:hypothetical protein